MIALSSNVAVTHSSLSPVSTHTQLSPSLKHIQPKPTIMGEPSGINPSLASLRKDRKEKPKKKKEKEGNTGGVAVTTNNNKQVLSDHSKCERPAVIKSTPCPSKVGETTPRKENVPILETPKMPTDSNQRAVPPAQSVIASPSPSLAKGVDQQTRLLQPPNMLKVNSPLRVTTPDHERKTPVTEDAQSPAYSDISDANESSSPQNDSPSKKDDIKKEKVSTPQRTQGEGGNMPGHYGMYNPYYGQQYMMSGSHMSPNTPKTHMGASENINNGEEKKSSSVAEDRKPNEKKPNEKDEIKNKLPEGHLPNNQNPQQMHPEYMQKYMQHVYAQIQSLPSHAQYQYLAHYGLIDPNQYQMQMMAQDPHVRQQYEKALEEKRAEQEQSGAKEVDSNKSSDSRPSSRELGQLSAENSVPKHIQQFSGHGGQALDGKKHGSSDRPTDRDIRDQNLREKQNENHQIMKENIELKSQMERPRHYDMQYDYRNQDELRRMQMFQQQKMYGQQKRKLELSSEPPELTSTESGSGSGAKKPAVSRPEGPKAPEHFREIKKEVVDPRDSRKSGHGHDLTSKTNTDVKSGDDKPRSSDKHRNSLEASKSKVHPPSSTSASLSCVAPQVPHNASYSSPYLQYPQYMQNPAGPYGHMPYDPNNAMYRPVAPHVIGYSGTPYMQGPQLGYPRVGGHAAVCGPSEPEKEKLDSSLNKSVNNSDTPENEGKVNNDNVPSGSPYNYGNVHKIHELGERGRPSSHGSSPAPTKSVGGESAVNPIQVHSGSSDKNRDYSNSPPTQRHLHTHHHTHVLSGFGPPMYDLPYNGKSGNIGGVGDCK